MIPLLNLGNLSNNANNTNDTNNNNDSHPKVPSLSLGLGQNSGKRVEFTDPPAPRRSPKLPLNISGQKGTETNKNEGSQVSGLNLSLNLLHLPPASSKTEHHKVFVCLPYTRFYSSQNSLLNQPEYDDFNRFQNHLPQIFGEGSTITQLSKAIPSYIINKSGPTLSDIDSAFQNKENLPFLIENCDSETLQLIRQCDQEISEIQELTNQKSKLEAEIAEIQAKIESNKKEIQQIQETTAFEQKFIASND